MNLRSHKNEVIEGLISDVSFKDDEYVGDIFRSLLCEIFDSIANQDISFVMPVARRVLEALPLHEVKDFDVKHYVGFVQAYTGQPPRPKGPNGYALMAYPFSWLGRQCNQYSSY